MAPTFLAEIITPEKILFRAPVEDVTLVTEDGEITFLANHADYLAAVDITLTKLYVADNRSVNEWMANYKVLQTGNAAKSPLLGVDIADLHASDTLLVMAAVHGGFVHVTQDGVRIFAPVAELASSIDKERAEAALNRINGPSSSATSELQSVGAEDDLANQAAPVLALSRAGRAILLPESSESKEHRAMVRLEAANSFSK